MSFSNPENPLISECFLRICPHPSVISVCVDCGKELKQNKEGFNCRHCGRKYHADEAGVWDFRCLSGKEKQPAIYDESEFLRWIRIFREKESRNWVIYKNRLCRFIAQAGHRQMGGAIRQRLANGDLVLEIGAGTGTLLEHIPAKNFFAVDMSLQSLHQIKSRWPDVTCVYASAALLPFQSGVFAHVVSIHTLEHLYFLAEAIQEMIRVMQPQGDMYYVIPTEGGLGFLLGRKLVTGRHLRRKYALDVDYVMDREHINNAPRVLKFLRMYYGKVESRYWPLPFLPLLGPNSMIYGRCERPRIESERDQHDDRN